MKKGEFVFEHFAGTVFRKTRHRIKALLKLGELECGFRDKFFKVVKKKKKKEGRKERWTLSLKFENGLFRIKNKLTVCSLPSFLPRTNGINFFNSERGVNLTPPFDLPVKSGKLTRASRSSISFLSSSFYAANEGREGPNEAIYFSSYSSSSNAASPLFREMEITRIKCLHPPQCRSTVPSSPSPPNLLQSFHGDTRLRSSGV